MFKPLILATILLLAQKPDTAKPDAPKQPEFGTIAGHLVPPDKMTIRQPLQVVLIPEPYKLMWNQKLQQENDTFWERYKPTLVQKKEFIYELYRVACQDTLQFVLARMSRDLGAGLNKYRSSTTPDGRFEFKNVPTNDYKVVAYGQIGTQTFFWVDSIDLNTGDPQFLTMTKHVP
jgi:hypothetical protein